MAKKSSIPDSYTLVTPANRKFSITLGRECFVSENGKIVPATNFIIRPRLKKGWYEWGNNKCFVTEEESAQEYADNFNEIITHFINQKRLYIDTSRKLITFKQNEKK